MGAARRASPSSSPAAVEEVRPLRADHAVHRAHRARGRRVPRRHLPGGHDRDGLRRSPPTATSATGPSPSVRHHRRARRGQAAHLRRRHPLLPGREPGAGRAAGGARASWRRACATSRSTASRSSARSTGSTDWSGCRSDGHRPGDVSRPTTRWRRGARAAGRGARLRVALVPRAHPHPGEPRDALPGRRRAAARVLPHLDPFVALAAAAARRRRGSSSAPGSAWCRSATRSHGEGGRDARPPLGRALPLRRRRRLEPRGDGEPRHRPAPPLAAACASASRR